MVPFCMTAAIYFHQPYRGMQPLREVCSITKGEEHTMSTFDEIVVPGVVQGLHHFNQLLCSIEHIELDQFTEGELRAIVKMAERIIAKRFLRRHQLYNPELTREFIRITLAMESNEVFYAIFLDNRHGVIAYEPLFFGTIDGASVHPRVVVERSLALGAGAIIVAHNHPSGVAEPSKSDRRITERLRAALALVDICLLDHVVVGGAEITSFSERGWM
jgi:DNA repair protein RadC